MKYSIDDYRAKNDFVGRDANAEDMKAIKTIAEMFAPAKGQPHVVWKKWSEEHNKWVMRNRQK